MSQDFEIIFSPQARQSLKKIPPNIQQRLLKKISLLSQNPRPSGVKVLKGEKGLLRIRVGDYRIIYTIENKLLIITIIQIGHRREIYRQF